MVNSRGTIELHVSSETTSRQNYHFPNKLENKWFKSPNTSVFNDGSSHFLPEDTYIASLFPC